MSHGQTGHRGLFQSGAATVLCTRADGGADIQVYKAIVEFVQSQEGCTSRCPSKSATSR
eukprot:COSAG04_NODE_69_length_29236_cov_15.813680_28_plen_59_part_00